MTLTWDDVTLSKTKSNVSDLMQHDTHMTLPWDEMISTKRNVLVLMQHDINTG